MELQKTGLSNEIILISPIIDPRKLKNICVASINFNVDAYLVLQWTSFMFQESEEPKSLLEEMGFVSGP